MTYARSSNENAPALGDLAQVEFTELFPWISTVREPGACLQAPSLLARRFGGVERASTS